MNTFSRKFYLPLIIFSFIVMMGCESVTSEDAVSFNDSSQFSITQANDNSLSQEQREAYQADAELLAIRYVNANDSTQTSIPSDLVNTLYHGLIHIATSDLEKAREVSGQEYNIHITDPVSPRQIAVSAEGSQSWVDAWRNGDTQTGNEAVDELINRFDLALVDFIELNLGQVTATLEASQPINIFAVSRFFRDLYEISDANPVRPFGSSRDIRVLFFDDYLRYDLIFGFGDCPAGCINQHRWKFNVYDDGTVEFVGEQGDALPDN